MTDYEPSLFSSDAEIARLGEGLLDCSLERADWTHEAHLGATAYLLTTNYRAILDYNCSNYYALSIGLLANAIARR